MNRKNARRKRTAILAYVFLYLSICAAIFISSTLSRFTSVGKMPMTASIACVSGAVNQSLQIAADGLYPGCAHKILLFEITNFIGSQKISEVSQEYTITVETAGNLPLAFHITGGSITQGGGTLIPNTALISGAPSPLAGFLDASSMGTIHTYELTVSWPLDKNDYAYSGSVDMITILVDASQAL